ncbi:hypothetical protein PORUE0001_1903 [Porphyromonas uenonis 60-3]|uniref:Uncharacterized protein n=1 Tax=Porphyromonas uenonis 60-3 TaxID=596327 RepID=C2MAJ8_9PORP|nr:hypothetical protein PORUE0001_1903 [Porphyromonas uenonis 60-3]
MSDDAGQEQSLLLEFKLSEQSGGGNTPSPDTVNSSDWRCSARRERQLLYQWCGHRYSN